QTVYGIAPVTADASDRVGVRSVTFFLDGHRLGPAVTHAPYALKWDTRKTQRGRHILSAKVINALGHEASTRVAVTVRNPAPPMTCFVLQRHLTAHGDGSATTTAFRTAVA